MNKTRKECLEETGYTPEQISDIARTHPALLRINTEMKENKNATHEAKVRWVYEGLKHQRNKMMKKNTFGPDMKSINHNKDESRAIGVNHNCTGSSACFGCEQERRDAYKSGDNYYA